MAIAWPRFMVLKCEAKNKYLSYMHESCDCNGYLRFSETLAGSPYTKFEVERAKCSGEDGLVHIKSCHNNKYWKRVKNVSITGKLKEQYWISAAAGQPEEGRTKDSCTLFKLIPVDTATNKIRIMHVQSGCYLCLCWVDPPKFNNYVLANDKVFDGDNSCDLFTVIDWELLANKPFASPRFMVLKCEARNKYLSYMRESCDCNGYLKFSETLAFSPYTKFEVERANGEDGLVHIKSCHNNQYCKRVKNVSITGNSKEQYWISAAADKPVEVRSKKSCTLFKLIPVDTATNKIRIMHVQSGCYLCLWWVDPPTFNNCVLANYEVFDDNSCDLFTVIDWELLANKPFASPRFIVLKSHQNNKYLGFDHEKGDYKDGYLKFSETRVASPYAKFEVEIAQRGGIDGLVHIRSSQNNKYLVSDETRITATAKKPEEDRSKNSCTLFKLISVDDAANEVQILHVQSRKYLWVKRETSNLLTSEHLEENMFTIIDWESLVFLPRHVAFKGNNGQYLCLRQIEGHPYLQFSSGDIGDAGVTMEVFMNNDGSIRIKPACSNKFWRRIRNWIWADSDDTTSNIKDTLFRPFKVNDQTIALRNLGNNNFCKSLSKEGKTNCLNANVSSITKDVQLRVEVPVLERKIYNIKYDLDNCRIYDESKLVIAMNSASNYTQKSESLDLKLSYTDTHIRTWKANVSLKVGAKATMNFEQYPKIIKGRIELSGEIQTGFEWEDTKTVTSVIDVLYEVVLPPMTKVTVNLTAINGTCDVPFTYMQKDSLYNGNIVISEVQGGTYTGSNYYSLNFQTTEESLSSSI
ncbi:hypothetical protein E1A91_D02G012100v1 [Gossypium mustelinum]|uniref:Agglutinin domain-containing protein n=1 Tax=Gossypium mustelinum TaxID=34275 RepID=A0A5D2VQS8_GOSMU|nr:hypothetical protein E1A91_D02G012100v1 [Gossypium mustelinum]